MGNRTIEEVYESHSLSAMRLALMLTRGDRQAAEDLVHEAFLRLLGRFGNLSTPTFIEAYLNRTIINLAKTTARKRAKERELLSKDKQRSHQTIASPIEEASDLMESILGLPIRQRAAVFLRYYADLPLSQIANSLNCSESAAKSLIHRALQQLRDEEVYTHAPD